MNRGVPLLAVFLLIASSPALGDSEALFTFSDPEGDNVFDVFFSLEGDNTLGLAMYLVVAENFDDFGLTNQNAGFTQDTLSTIRASDYAVTGFVNSLEGPIGDYQYDYVGDQFGTSAPILNVGMEPIFVAAAPELPAGSDVVLNKPALLGQFDLGTDRSFSDDDLHQIFRTTALVFDQSGSTTSVFQPNVYLTVGTPAEKRLISINDRQPDPIDTPPPVDPPGLGPAPTPAISPPPTADLLSGDVVFTFQNLDQDDTYEVFVEVSPEGSDGLASFVLEVNDRNRETALDFSTVAWRQGNLDNLSEDLDPVGFVGTGIETPVVFERAFSVGDDQYSAENPLLGVGQTPLFSAAFDGAPDNLDIDLDVPAFLGVLTIPGAETLSAEDLIKLFRPSASLFGGDLQSGLRSPSSITARLITETQTLTAVVVPEPATVMLAALGLVGCWVGRPRGR